MFGWDIDFDRLFTSGRLQLTSIVAAYALIVYLTNRILITSPARLALLQSIDEERVEVEIRSTEKGVEGGSWTEGVRYLLDTAKREVTIKVFGERARPLITLAKVQAGSRYLHAAQRLRARYLDKDHGEILRLSAERLRHETWTHAKSTATEIDKVLERAAQRTTSGANDEFPALVSEALRLWFDHEDDELERAAEAQRRTMWLVVLGLFAVLVLGLTGHRTPLLFGAFGGLLAPVARVWQSRLETTDYESSWGVLLLGPIAGALAAFAGLLIIGFLANGEVKLLGEFFRNNSWDNPDTTPARAIAFLLGFSAPLLGNLAGVAGQQLTPTPKHDDAAEGAGGGDESPPSDGPSIPARGGAGMLADAAGEQAVSAPPRVSDVGTPPDDATKPEGT